MTSKALRKLFILDNYEQLIMKKFSLVIIATIIVACGICQAEINTKGFCYYGGHMYVLCQDPEGVTWQQAKDFAKTLETWRYGTGAYLVVITSAEENKRLYDMIKDVDDDDTWTMQDWGSGIGPWIGLYKKNGVWKWVTGAQVKYTNWQPGEPNNAYGNENYAAFAGKESLKGSRWDDIQNSVRTNSFIVEIDHPA